MFDLATFKATIKQDNPTFERFRSSDLHALVEVLSRNGRDVNAVAREMKRISGQKWQKYTRTRDYLLAEMPTLESLVTASLVNFKTLRLVAQKGGSIQHQASWESDSGRLADLGHVRVREQVSWGAAAQNAAGLLDPLYQVAGHHFGVGNAVTSPGTIGSMTDNHDARGAWDTGILNLPGNGPFSYVCQQVYQVSNDSGNTWQDIPNTHYEIVRTVSRTRGTTKLEIRKRSVPPNTRREDRSNSVELPGA
jgi:hypothetical protein